MADETPREPQPPNGGGQARTEEATTRDLLRTFAEEVRELIRLELQLARAELRDQVVEARRAGMLMGGAALLALVGAILVPFSAAYALGLVMPLWSATLIVGVILLLAAAGLLKAAQTRLREAATPPESTLSSLEEDRRWIQEQIRSERESTPPGER